MKNIIVLFFAMVAAVAAQAQSESKYRTDVSMRSQLVNNNVPGAVYRDASVKTGKSSAAVPQKSIGTQMKENAVPGVRYKTSASEGGTAAKQPEASSSDVQVASEKKAEKLPAVKQPEAPQLTQ